MTATLCYGTSRLVGVGGAVVDGGKADARVAVVKDHQVARRLSRGWTLGPCPPTNNKRGEDPGEEASSMEVTSLSLEAYPNPFEVATTLRFRMGYDDKASLEIFNLTGERIAELFTGELKPEAAATEFKTKHAEHKKVRGISYICLLSCYIAHI